MDSTIFMVLIDGTGPYDEQQYARDFENSFLHQIHKKLGNSKSVYFEGPGTLGITTRSRANKGYDSLVARRSQNRKCRLFIAGYSRGGAAAMELAKICAYGKMDEDGQQSVHEVIPIEALFLLDPVSKDVFCLGGGVPNNVRTSYVMYRDKTIWEYSPVLKTEDFASWVDKTLAVGFNSTGQNDPDRYARKFMKNASYTLADSNGRTDMRKGITIRGASHGAIGGLPWVERREDEAAVNAAGGLLNGWLNEQRIGITVKDNSYTEANKRKYPEVTPELLEADKQRRQSEVNSIKNDPRYRATQVRRPY
ncbi:hypothetical protein [Roseibium sp.]|uniref:hypothetical protein n=1 Tax=Roseibium sp. TaxID=1936156 RepID=UPI003B50891C